jgi:hypothetical protein
MLVRRARPRDFDGAAAPKDVARRRHADCWTLSPEGVASMLDRTLAGARCRTVRPIAHHGGYLPRMLQGTIRYQVENLGRKLINVDFDSGQSMMVFADDVIVDAHQAVAVENA